MVAQVDHVPGLLAAEQRALALERLQDVAVADVGGVHADVVLAHQRVEAEVRHHGDRHLVDLLVEREDRDDLVAVDRLAPFVDREHAVAVAVERDPEVEPAVEHGLLQEREIGRAAADVDVRTVGLVADRVHLCAAPFEGLGRETRSTRRSRSRPRSASR